jgi:ABC-type transport system substrate-binding protein
MNSTPWRSEQTVPDSSSSPLTRRSLLALAALGVAAGAGSAAVAAPQGQLTYGVHISLAPAWFDPAETTGLITPFLILYALHDGLVKAMPGELQASSLAESWSASEDGLTYDFDLQKGALFHNGDPVTSDDVKFSFERYHGSSQSLLKQRVDAIDTSASDHVRIKLKEPWPDFLTFYAGATGAAWIVPRKYVTQVGDDGFRKAPVGAGPYRFVSFTPGVELVLEAFEAYWRNTPRVKRLVLKVIPDEATRLAALKRGEIDIAYSIRGELAEELQRTPGLSLKPVVVQGTFAVYFADQWDPKSPWHDQRVRLAASLAIDRETINQALTMGFSHVTGSSIFPDTFEFYWQPPEPVYDPAQARRLLAAAGYPRFRRRAVFLRFLLRQHRRGGGQRPARGRGSLQTTSDRACRVHQGLHRQDVQEPHTGRARRVRQRGDPAREPGGSGRPLCLWQLPGHRCPVSATGGGAGSRAARGHPAQDAADGSRAVDLRADLAACLHQWRGAACCRIELRAHSGIPLYRTLR